MNMSIHEWLHLISRDISRLGSSISEMAFQDLVPHFRTCVLYAYCYISINLINLLNTLIVIPLGFRRCRRPVLVKGNYQARVSLPLKGCTSVSVTNKNKFQSQKKIGRKRRRRRKRKRIEIAQPETMTAGRFGGSGVSCIDVSQSYSTGNGKESSRHNSVSVSSQTNSCKKNKWWHQQQKKSSTSFSKGTLQPTELGSIFLT